MTKELFVVCVDYNPAIASTTIPLLKEYAKKINAAFTVITERKYPKFPPTYEKMQVHELGKDNDCNILVDCDMFISKAMYDVTEVVSEGVGAWEEYDPSLTIKRDEYIKLDGSDRIPATNFMVVWKDQHETWKPFDITFEEASSRMKRLFVIDEYCVGRNIKRCGFLVRGLLLPGTYGALFYHKNLTTNS